MRRRDREITNRKEILDILKNAKVCRIALHAGEYPYIVPLNFGFEDKGILMLYFHCASEGKKLELIRQNNKVGFEVDTEIHLELGANACDCSMFYKSVIGNGTVEIIQNTEEKIYGLNVLMNHYTDKNEFQYNEELLKRTIILRLTVTQISGKSHEMIKK